ncbi:MAG: hypothetical protein KBC02_01170 [Candidatus Pacebacteria bacterium]|nr:hypothetical protein [Candidatus Paceibacterota bacterium]
MAKSILREQARALRRQGASISDVTKRLGVSKSSASRWCADLELTAIQQERLAIRTQGAVRLGQLRGALAQKKKRQTVVDFHMQKGLQHFATLTDAEFFMAGIALYLAEGAKTMRQVHFVNADPRVVLFMMRWLRRFYNKGADDFSVSVLINEQHRLRERRIVEFWSNYLSIPAKQFRKTVFVRTLQKKIYENTDRYYGTLRFTVLKSTQLYYIISGLMEGLLQHVPKPA